MEIGIGGFFTDRIFDDDEIADLEVHFGGVFAVENAVQAIILEGRVEVGDEGGVTGGRRDSVKLNAVVGEIRFSGGGEFGEESGERSTGRTE